jgi:hypothetical protein
VTDDFYYPYRITALASGDVWFGGFAGAIFQRDTGITVNPTGFVVGPGAALSGNLASLFTSDDNRLVARPGIVLTSPQAPIGIVVEGVVAGSPSRMQVVIESSASQGGILETVEAYNFATNTYNSLGTAALTTTDAGHVMEIPDVASHIGPGNVVRVRLRYKATTPVLAYPWLARLDQVVWRILP